MKKLMIALCLIAQTSHAEEGATSAPMAIGGGLICDTLEQAVSAIQNPNVAIDGCGILRGTRMATVTPLPVLEHNGLVFRMARYDFLQPTGFGQVQYGFWGKPQVIPASLTGEEA